MDIGIDLGSRTVKIVVKKGDDLLKQIFETGTFYRDYSWKTSIDFSKLLKDIGMKQLPKTYHITACGYGRVRLEETEYVEVISELKAHVQGVVHQTGISEFILLDIGGQDSKAIYAKNSKMADFATNDKCAASTGRYVENMANVLGVTLEEMGKYNENPVELNSTCAIFGESEVIGLIAEGIPIEQIIAGVNFSIYNRVKSLISGFPKGLPLVLSGGVAKNFALKNLFEIQRKWGIIELPLPQYNGAIGCINRV